MSGPVVVGVDGTVEALRAVRWAAAHAALRGAGLRLVHATTPSPGRTPGALLAAKAVADEVTAEVEVVVGDGLAAALLVRESPGAAAVVLGSPGHGGYFGRLIGPTVVTVAARAQCPMVVVGRPGVPGDGPVVVGVDGTPTSDAALDFAMHEAWLRGAGLVAVHAVPDGRRDRAEDMVADRLTQPTARYPDVKVIQEVVADKPGLALLDRAVSAQLVVVGSGRRTGYRGTLLRSTSQRLLHDGSCPVAVVRRDHPV